MHTLTLLVSALCATAHASPVHSSAHDLRSHSTQQPLLKDYNALGDWFQDVADIPAKTPPANAAALRNSTIAIVGAGITGLAAALMLDSVGMRNYEIIEASNRVGGRFRTIYVGGTQEWAEMGPMRLPERIVYKDGSEEIYTDHAMVGDLVDILNEKNAEFGQTEREVNFIEWVQHHPNEILGLGTGRHSDGRIPTRAEIEANPRLGRASPSLTAEYNTTKARLDGILRDIERLKEVQRDVWRSHARAMNEGLDDWSQQGMMRHMFYASANVTDEITTASDYDTFWDEIHHNSNLALDGGPSAAGLTYWRCIDGGFNRLSDAFLPHVSDRLTLNRKIRAIEAVSNPTDNRTQTKLSWLTDNSTVTTRTPNSKTYDYTLMTAPFPQTRLMSLPRFSPILSRAISEPGLRFKSACKVALLFNTRFWEAGPRPIFGGYSTPPSASIGALYYPTYGFNETGRPGLIMHYRGADWSDRFAALPPDEHAARVLDAIVSIHGNVARDEYNGTYERLCWLEDEHTSVAWARPDPGQHKLYIPAYHTTENNVVFVGEHTSSTHAWVSSSLQSAVRGVVQVLLELGLVEEAKRVNGEWMGRWIK